MASVPGFYTTAIKLSNKDKQNNMLWVFQRHSSRDAGIQSQGERSEGFEFVSCPQFTILGTGYPYPCGYDDRDYI
jgi:hypothetical protein